MHGVPIEVQIRTRQMESVANNGISGHWLYKADEASFAGSQARARQWLRDLLDLQQRAGSSLEFIESLKIDLFPGRGLRVLAEGRNLRTAARRMSGRLRLRRAHRHRQ